LCEVPTNKIARNHQASRQVNRSLWQLTLETQKNGARHFLNKSQVYRMFSFSLMMLSHALKKSRAYGSMLDFSRLENGSTTTGVAGPFFQNVKPPMKTCESTGSNQKKKRLQHSRITTAQVIFSRMGETSESLTRKSAAWSDLISDPTSLI